MQPVSPDALTGLAVDILAELSRLRVLTDDILAVQREIERDPAHARLFYENLALKLHNFYTGCERIFQTVASELNGGWPTGFDWHRRLLERMGTTWQGRPALLSATSVESLREYLAFRHVVRHIYGFELDVDRVRRLTERYPQVWQQVEADVLRFVGWLETLSRQLAES
ncbi:MAG: hypothetical protein NZ528_16385 [Caldilineales bacterium]|nr:hypothetical protein [Caldilineales bacterium]MDW8319302.1 hypothetical protein [Anaerolineae bacterium]